MGVRMSSFQGEIFQIRWKGNRFEVIKVKNLPLHWETNFSGGKFYISSTFCVSILSFETFTLKLKDEFTLLILTKNKMLGCNIKLCDSRMAYMFILFKNTKLYPQVLYTSQALTIILDFRPGTTSKPKFQLTYHVLSLWFSRYEFLC